MKLRLQKLLLILLIPLLFSAQVAPLCAVSKAIVSESPVNDNLEESDFNDFKKQEQILEFANPTIHLLVFSKQEGEYQEGHHPILSSEPATPPPKA